MPLLTGNFVDAWATQLAHNPEVKKVLSDLHRFSVVSERIATVAEKLPDELASQEGRLREVLGDLQQTMKVGNELVSQVNTTVKTVEPLINQYYADRTEGGMKDFSEATVKLRAAAQELNATLQSFEQLLASPGWEKTLPQIFKTFNRAESETEEMMNHAFFVGVGLILVFFLTLFVYRYGSKRFNL
jgi:ABC-type transporter Mla subunit MlaD